jgi:anhydro-N-acetylmuramic acid kinase
VKVAKARRANLYIGLMSGTSADGIDAVLAEIAGTGGNMRPRLLCHIHKDFPPRLRAQILRVCLHGHVAEICELNFDLGYEFAAATLALLKKAKVSPSAITAIGSHGQTIHHLPNARIPCTLQIGEAAVIAERTGITTVSDFRVGDMATGGQGAPLVPYADWVLFSHPSRPRIVQNIGGIGNLTLLPPNAGLRDIVAFDTGPGNMLIDAVVSEITTGRLGFDRDGKIAATGSISRTLLAELMRHPYIRRKPPKTTGREEFGEPVVNQIMRSARRLGLAREDIVATVTAFTAESIAFSYERFVFPKLRLPRESDGLATKPVQVILGGGGAKNPTLRSMLRTRLPIAEIRTHDEFGIENSAKEALAFAILARETMRGVPSNVPFATGARKPVVLGKITRPFKT